MENEAIEMVSEVVEEAAPEIIVAVDTNKSFMKGAATGSAATLGCVLAYKFVVKPVIAKIKQKRKYTDPHVVDPENLENYEEEIDDDSEE